MDALVLSGGNIKGAYQAGVIAGLTEKGFVPKIVTGSSVGALHAGELAASHGVPWPERGQRVADFWLEQVTSPAALLRTRGPVELLWRVFTKRWNGAANMDPMVRLVRKRLTPFLRDYDPDLIAQIINDMQPGQTLTIHEIAKQCDELVYENDPFMWTSDTAVDRIVKWWARDDIHPIEVDGMRVTKLIDVCIKEKP